MEILSKLDAQALTEIFHQVWVEAHIEVVEMWKKRMADDPEFFGVLSRRSKLNVLHDLIVATVARRLHGQVVVTEALQFFALVVADQVMIRFKHLDEELRPRSYPTVQQESLSEQAFTVEMIEQLALDGIAAPLTVLTVGYSFTVSEDEVQAVSVVCRQPELVYSYDIYRDNGGELSSMEVAPLPGIPPKAPRVVSKRPKKSETSSSS